MQQLQYVLIRVANQPAITVHTLTGSRLHRRRLSDYLHENLLRVETHWQNWQELLPQTTNSGASHGASAWA